MMGTAYADRWPISFQNVSDEEAPPFALMQIAGRVTDQTDYKATTNPGSQSPAAESVVAL